jgi:hypothetical protein
MLVIGFVFEVQCRIRAWYEDMMKQLIRSKINGQWLVGAIAVGRTDPARASSYVSLHIVHTLLRWTFQTTIGFQAKSIA